MATLDDLRTEDGRIDARSVASSAGREKATSFPDVSASECALMRRQLLSGESIRNLSESGKINRHQTTVRRHVTGECQHTHGSPPALVFVGSEVDGEWVLRGEGDD